MTLSYALRLIVVSLAAFAIIFMATGVLVSFLAGGARRRAARMQADAAARFILLLRLLPAGLAVVVVAAFCVPSYIQFEQRGELEQAGPLCLSLACISLAFLISAGVRTFRAWLHSAHPGATIALVGIVRPHVLVSEEARNYLAPAELSMALRHEESHAKSHDNLKRLLILLAPGPFPGFRDLERNWKLLAEYAADEHAAAGDPERSLSLAAALVRIAKLGVTPEPPLVTSFLAAANDLESRVDRLLNPKKLPRTHFLPAAYCCSALAIVAAVLHPAMPIYVHGLLEHLLH
jgi:hypothetical protein